MVFHNRTFCYLFVSYGISLLGTCFSTIAINLWILQTTGSARLMFVFFLTNLVVSLVLGNIAGTVVDRVDRRTIMWQCDLGNALITATIAVLMFIKITPIPLMVAICALQVFVSLFHYPAFQASLSSVLEKEQISKAMGAINIIDNIARILGLAVGGTVVGIFGGFTAFSFDSATYVISAIFVLLAGKFPSRSLQEEPTEPADQTEFALEKGDEPAPARKPGFFEDFKTGIAFMLRDPFARSVLVMLPILASFFTLSLMMIQVTAINIWKATPLQFGIIEACVPFGYITGSVLMMRLDERIARKGYWIFAGALTLGPIYLVISQIHQTSQTYAAIFLLGFMFSLCTLLINITMRVEISPDLQGRAFGMIGTVTSPLMTIGVGTATYFADKNGPQAVLVVSGIVLTILAVVLCFALTSLREYRNGPALSSGLSHEQQS